MGKIKMVSFTLLMLLCCAGSAQAAQRFAAPGGNGTACTGASPCSLETAVDNAKNGDEVIIGGGTYFLSEAIAPIEGAEEIEEVDIHGDFSGPPPQIVASSGEEFFTPLALPGQDSTLSYLQLSVSGEEGRGGISCQGSTIERVSVVVSAPLSTGITMYGECTVRDSTVWMQGASSGALSATAFGGSPTAIVRNVTAEATGAKSVALSATFTGIGFGSGTDTLDVANTIASGTMYDLLTTIGEGPGEITVSHSNYRTKKGEGAAKVTDAGGNQSASPLFVGASTGDFRELAGSPTIDAGQVDADIGALDLAGNPRVIGVAPDIGAYEFVPPPPAPPGGGSGGSNSSTGGGTPPPPQALIQSLSISPSSFSTSSSGGGGKGRKKPPGASVQYKLSAAGTVSFTVAEQLPGRKVGGRCVAPTKGNAGKAKCSRSRPVKGTFTDPGAVGQNSFHFAGKVGGKTLAPGSYKLIGSSGGVSKEAAFTVVP